jgi:hypothetical protein
MNLTGRQAAGILLAVVYLGSGLGLAFERHEDCALVTGTSSALTALQSGNGAHASIPGRNHLCPACAQSLQRVSTSPVTTGQLGLLLLYTRVVPQGSEAPVQAERPLAATRAPPSASL